jgi:hypothetical protein
MAEIEVIASGVGTVTHSFDNSNDVDDHVVLIIRDDFQGTIQISSIWYDGDSESVEIQRPPGWEIRLEQQVPLAGESPNAYEYSYKIFDANGVERGTIQLRVNEVSVTCFTKGTLLEDAFGGQVKIEDVSLGDKILTIDDGPQVVKWIGSRKISKDQMSRQDSLWPVRIKAGALGLNWPAKELVLSQQHRVLISSKIAKRIHEEDDVLVPAKSLAILDGVTIENPSYEIEYFHLMFDSHQLVLSNGYPTESFYVGSEALKTMTDESLWEILTIFPDLEITDFGKLARTTLTKRDGEKLALRHQKNGRPFLENFSFPSLQH